MLNLFSKQKHEDERADVYRYEELPEPLKLQILYVWRDLARYFGIISASHANSFYSAIRQATCEKYGLFFLIDNSTVAEQDVCNFFLREQDTGKGLGMIEIAFDCFARFAKTDTHVYFDWWDQFRNSAQKLNAYFQEHAVGYEYRDGKIIRIDSEFMHSEAVTPALALLRETHLAGANQEFLKAHEHFRHQRLGECINECLKAFESTMKAICHKRKWTYNQNDTAKTLLATCEKNGLFPAFMQSSLSGLRSVLESVPTVRNKLSGHGQGAQPVQITPEVAAFVLHSTGANILLLASLEKKLK